MTASIVYYSDAFSPWKESLSSLLERFNWPIHWVSISSLNDCPVGAFVLLAQHDLTSDQLPYIASRRVLLLVEQWSLDASMHWVAQGAQQSLELSDCERIAAWLVAQWSQRDVARLSEAESENMLQTVIDAIPVPIFFKDELHVYRGCNKAFSQFIGLPVDKVVGHSVYDISPKELADVYYEADCQLLASGGKQVYEAKVKSSSGEVSEIEFNKAVFYKKNGEKGGQVGAMLNITERNQLMRKLEQASLTDPLTGIGNRREFDIAVKQARQSAEHAPSLLIIDLDHFKQINDEFGHDGGDQALQFVVNTLQSLMPDNASIYRIGGEEFYILMDATDLDTAYAFAEQIREYLPLHPFTIKGTRLRMTMSVGVVELNAEKSLGGMLKRVDQALYQAKHLGRNQVCLAKM